MICRYVLSLKWPPVYFVWFVQLIFVWKTSSGVRLWWKWFRRLENNVIGHLFILILILHLSSWGSDIVMTLFNFVTDSFMLPDRTVTFVSSACIETAALSFSLDPRSFMYTMNNADPNRLPWLEDFCLNRTSAKLRISTNSFEVVMYYVNKLRRNSCLN
jgi:hypothetical protein